jgi:hypothetical protein
MNFHLITRSFIVFKTVDSRTTFERSRDRRVSEREISGFRSFTAGEDPCCAPSECHGDDGVKACSTELVAGHLRKDF